MIFVRKLMPISIVPQVFEYLVTNPLFQLYESSSISTEDSHLRRIIEHLGPFPENFLAGCSRREKYFNDRGTIYLSEFNSGECFDF